MTPRLLLLTTNLARGGAETQVAQLALGLRARDWDVSVASLVPPTAFAEELAGAGIPVYATGLRGLPNVLARLRPQIVHSHMFHANIVGRAARTVYPIPVTISTLHSAKESSRTSASAGGRDWLYRLTDPWAEVTVAVSQAVAERHSKARAVPLRKLRVIPNGVDTERFHPPEIDPQNIEFTWLAAGRLMWKKDYPTLLQAFAGIKGARLLIAGSGEDEARLREAAPPNVTFLGARSDMPELMRSADGFVLSSVVEGCPVVLLEAAASGLACVATDAGGVGETRPVELVPTSNPEALAAAMTRLMELPFEARRNVGAAARRHIVEHFSWPVILAEWEQLYRELYPDGGTGGEWT